MKVLVLGASGMAGHIITMYFKEQGYEQDLLVALFLFVKTLLAMP